ncbi:MAG: hypothetical protein ACR2ID_09190 [Chthoniobacterales bacterium]
MPRFHPIARVSVLAICGGLLSAAAPLPRSVSVSRQFIVYGADARLRGAICDLAENTKKVALSLIAETDRWKTPILVNAQYPQANRPELPPARLTLSQTGFGLKLQLDLTIGADVSAPAVEHELLRALFLEMIYRQQPNTPAGASYIEPPEWLLAGAQATGQGRDLAPLADGLAVPIASGRILPLQDFLRQQPALLDSPSRALYRAYAAAVVAMLHDTPEGRAGLARFVGDLTQSSNDPLADLRAHFPSLGENTAKIEEHWTNAVMQLAQRDRYRLLDCRGTESALALALQVGITRPHEPASIHPLEDFATFRRDPAAPAALLRLKDELSLLASRAHPLYRPVILGYQEIIRLLQARKLKKIPHRLAELRSLREQLTRRMDAVGDYLNWFEATQARTASGAFDEYMKAAERAVAPPARRRDAISVYLDAMEAQY